MTHFILFARPLGFLTAGVVLGLTLVGCGNTPSAPETNPSTTHSPTSAKSGGSPGASTAPGAAQPPESKKEPAVVVKPGDFSLSAVELQAEFNTDKNAAVTKYQGKTLDLSGAVKAVSDDGPERGLVEIVTGEGSLGLPCYTIDKEPFARLAPGQTLKVQGVWPKTAAEPRLRDCVIVEAGPSTAIAMTALQLATEYASDPEGVKTKYDGKSLLLSGEVVGKATRDSGSCTLFLKGAEKAHVEASFDAVYAGRTAKIKDGQPIKLLARFDKSACYPETIKFSNPGIITK